MQSLLGKASSGRGLAGGLWHVQTRPRRACRRIPLYYVTIPPFGNPTDYGDGIPAHTPMSDVQCRVPRRYWGRAAHARVEPSRCPFGEGVSASNPSETVGELQGLINA
jgi:hypothetical protein